MCGETKRIQKKLFEKGFVPSELEMENWLKSRQRLIADKSFFMDQPQQCDYTFIAFIVIDSQLCVCVWAQN